LLNNISHDLIIWFQERVIFPLLIEIDAFLNNLANDLEKSSSIIAVNFLRMFRDVCCCSFLASLVSCCSSSKVSYSDFEKVRSPDNG